MKIKNLLVIMVIILNSLIMYLYDINMVNTSSSVFLILSVLNFLYAFLIIQDCLGRINNISSLFLFFWSLYIIFPLLYDLKITNVYIHLNNVALITFMIIFTLVLQLYQYEISKQDSSFFEVDFKNINFKFLGIFVIYTSMVMEGINFFRAGGFSELYKGKANFISQVQDLFLTLPAFDLLFIGIIIFLLGDFFSRKNNRSLNLLFYITMFALCCYYMLISLRTNILSIVTLILMIKSYDKFIKRINLKLIIIALFFFLTLSIIGYNRSVLSQIDFSDIKSTIQSIEFNPFSEIRNTKRTNEFTSAAENFTLYWNNPEKLNNHFVIGRSYVDGILYIFPRYLYPLGDKPIQPTTIFRNEYVSERVGWGSQATTGYSTIIEGYVNGKVIGVVFYYALISMFFVIMEIKRFETRSVIFNVFYLTTVPILFTFSRRAFAIIFSGMFNSIVYTIFIVITYVYIKQLINNRYRFPLSRVGS